MISLTAFRYSLSVLKFYSLHHIHYRFSVLANEYRNAVIIAWTIASLFNFYSRIKPLLFSVLFCLNINIAISKLKFLRNYIFYFWSKVYIRTFCVANLYGEILEFSRKRIRRICKGEIALSKYGEFVIFNEVEIFHSQTTKFSDQNDALREWIYRKKYYVNRQIYVYL